MSPPTRTLLKLLSYISYTMFSILFSGLAFAKWLYAKLSPLCSWIWGPALRFLSRLPLPWPERRRNELEQSEGRRYSSDEEKWISSGGQQESSHVERRQVEDEFSGDDYRVDKTDELYCGYDSTWDSEESESSPRTKIAYSTGYRNYRFSRFESAAKDMWNYRHDYPNLRGRQNVEEQEHDPMPNLNFYLGKTPSLPDGVYIYDFHSQWYGNYARLEHVHTYIQWLFPLQEPGMNYEAKPLTKQEIQEFCNSDVAKQNLLKSYRLMLDFYGIELKDEKTGEVERAVYWRERFRNLDSHTHNNLRITRILKCLGTLGYTHFQAPLVRFFLEEVLVQGELCSVKDSALNYFLFAVRNKQERRKLLKFAYENYEPKEEFMWCPKKIQMIWKSLSQGQNQRNDERDGWDSTSLPCQE